MTRMSRRAEAAKGFTLIELMTVVAIIGLLASVALPQYKRATLRSRAAERSTIVDAIGRAMNDVISNSQALPTGTDVWSGVDNPAVPSAQKRNFNYAAAGWEFLPVIVQGDAYYAYSFVARDPGRNGQALVASVLAIGDLDGDGAPSPKQVNYASKGYTLYKTTEVPEAGFEDQGTF